MGDLSGPIFVCRPRSPSAVPVSHNQPRANRTLRSRTYQRTYTMRYQWRKAGSTFISLSITRRKMHHSSSSAYQCKNYQVVVPCKDHILDFSSIKTKQNSNNREQGQYCGQRVHFSRRFTHDGGSRRQVMKART